MWTAIAVGFALTAILCSACTKKSEAATAGSAQDVNLTLGIWDKKQEPAIQKLADLYHEQHPNVTVTIQLTPYKEYWTKLEASALGGTAPDVFWMNGLNVEKYVEASLLIDLTEELKKNGITGENFPQSLLNFYTFNGKTFGVPKDFDTNALWFNKEIFDAAKVPYPNDNWTWEDMKETALKLTDPAKNIYGIAAPLDFQTCYYNTIFGADGYILNADKTKSGYDDPKTIEGIQIWVDLIKAGVSPSYADMTDVSADALFESGRIAMLWAGSYMTPEYLQNDFDNDNNLLIHKGYFSGDKGNADEKIKAGVNEILRDKKKLLSFESPTRFIFSIWALQEGWDNPNVFTICKLSNQGSEISKLQQIGRGLRICVNQDLQRYTLKKLNDNQEAFWKINNLDVVVSSKEQGFVEAIQNEILSNSFLVSETFTEQELIKILKEKSGFDDDTVVSLVDDVLKEKKIIIRKAIVDGQRVYEKSPNFSVILKEQNLPEAQEQVIRNLFATDTATYVQKADKKKAKKKVFIKATHLQEFKNLWNAINKNAFYVLGDLTDEQEKLLIQNIKTQIEELNIEQILLQTTRAELDTNNIGAQGAITETLIDTVSYKSKVDYLELVRTLSTGTKTPISFVVKVFNALSDDFKNKMLTNNPEQAVREISEIIKKNLIAMLKANITYDGIDGVGLPNVFKIEEEKTYLDTGSTGKFQKDITSDFSLKTKWVFEEVIEYDSDFELEIVEQDPDIEKIEIFGKLPRLKIKTPLGDYNPDFCYAIKSTEGKKVFLIVEAKGYKTSTEIPADEKTKIDFAKKYFEVLNECHKDKNIKISFKERIGTTQLAALITEDKK